jgi:tRNA A-37 threonylcarbamoyl transferase component Bud32
MDETEEVLVGGFVASVVRVGATVRRTFDPAFDAGYVVAVLEWLADAGFAASPRFLGWDSAGRQVLSYVEGACRFPAVEEHSLLAAARLTRQFHDLTAGSALAGAGEVVCHHDLDQRNTIFSPSGGVVAFIDWDMAGPGRRMEDLARLCWQYPDLGPARDGDVEVAARSVRRAVEAYGEDAVDRSALFDEIVACQNGRADGIEESAAGGWEPCIRLVESGVPSEIRAKRDWLIAHRKAFDLALA